MPVFPSYNLFLRVVLYVLSFQQFVFNADRKINPTQVFKCEVLFKCAKNIQQSGQYEFSEDY